MDDCAVGFYLAISKLEVEEFFLEVEVKSGFHKTWPYHTSFPQEFRRGKLTWKAKDPMTPPKLPCDNPATLSALANVLLSSCPV